MKFLSALALIALLFNVPAAQSQEDECWTPTKIILWLQTLQPRPSLHTPLEPFRDGQIMAVTGLHRPGDVFAIEFDANGCASNMGWMPEAEFYLMTGGA